MQPSPVKDLPDGEWIFIHTTGLASILLTLSAMSGAHDLHTIEPVRDVPPSDDDLTPRRPATVQAIDARLSVWGPSGP